VVNSPECRPVHAAAFSRDGRRIVTASRANPLSADPVQASLWDVTTGRKTLTLPDAGAPVALSPDGRILATGGDLKGFRPDDEGKLARGTRLWDAEAGGLLGSPLIQESPPSRQVETRRPVGKPFVRRGNEIRTSIVALSFRPTGDLVVAIGEEDRTVRLYEATTGQPIGAALGPHAGPVVAVAIDPDLGRVVTGSVDGMGRLWESVSGKPVGLPLTHQGAIRAAAFGPDGQTVATASEDAMVRLWDAYSGRPIGPPLRHPGPIDDVSFSPDGKMLLTVCDDGNARLWRVPVPEVVEPERWRWAIQAMTGMELDEFGTIRLLDPRNWQDRQRRLESSSSP
jgi:WD40 repeat protein